MTWGDLVPLLADFWHIVCTRLEARSRAGRLKQWLNFLRRRFPEAETAYQQLRTVNDPALIDAWLTGLRQVHAPESFDTQPLHERATASVTATAHTRATAVLAYASS